MDNDKLTNYNERNIESVDGFLCDDGGKPLFPTEDLRHDSNGRP